MDEQPILTFIFSSTLSDEAAYERFELLKALSLAFEERYVR